jgi:hypothetical protein
MDEDILEGSSYRHPHDDYLLSHSRVSHASLRITLVRKLNNRYISRNVLLHPKSLDRKIFLSGLLDIQIMRHQNRVEGWPAVLDVIPSKIDCMDGL